MPMASLLGRLESPVTWSHCNILGYPLAHLGASGAVGNHSSSLPSLKVRTERAHSMQHPAHSVSPEKFSMLAWASSMVKPSPNFTGLQYSTALVCSRMATWVVSKSGLIRSFTLASVNSWASNGFIPPYVILFALSSKQYLGPS